MVSLYDDLPTEFRDLLRECNRIPVAIAIAGGAVTIAQPVTVGDVSGERRLQRPSQSSRIFLLLCAFSLALLSLETSLSQLAK